jgi:putative hydrolase of the HAD superfamily
VGPPPWLPEHQRRWSGLGDTATIGLGMNAPKAIFFDLNGTLVDHGGAGEAILVTCRAVAAARPGLDPDRLAAANADVWRDYWPQVEDRWNVGVLDGAAISLEAWTRALRACGCDDAALARLATDALRRHARDTVRLFDDARELLGWLAGAGLPLAVITNAAADSARDALRALGIEGRFDAVVVSGEVGVAKPDPALFAVATERLGVRPDDVWHVGDSLAADVAGAKAAGLGAVWLNRGGLALRPDDPPPDREIRSLRELTDLLRVGT